MSMYKFSGAGNDFVVLDGRQGGADAFRQAARITALCKEYRTDGLMILGQAPGYDFAMEFYNPDGSGGMMCGNGGRCIVAFADYLGLQPASPDGLWHFLAPDGPHEAQILQRPGESASGGHVHPRTWVGGGARWIQVPEGDAGDSGRGRSERSERSSSGGTLSGPWTVKLKMIDVEGVKPMMGGYFLNTGTRHFVKFVPDIEGIDMEKDGPEIRWDDAFQPEGTNANFVQVAADGLHVRTFEKGVEAETLACGTGLTASAIVAYHTGQAQSPVRLQCRRGDWLHVAFNEKDGRFTDVYLTGPAELVRMIP